MFLKKIKLKNFRQYYGEQELEFSTHPEKNITLIYGKNGAGKTSFFTALNWVLYGSTEVKIEGKIVNKKAIEEAKEKGKKFVTGEVVLFFSHEGIDYEIKRKIIHDIDNAKESNEEVEMTQLHPKVIKIHEPLIKLNPILPPNVRTYFFFDGEKIDEFSKPKHDKEVKEAVYKVLGVTVIERAINHLKDITKEYNREISKKSSGRLKELHEKYERLLEEKEKTEEELNNLKEERRNLEIQLEEIKGRLREIEEIQEYVKERDKVENQITETEDKLKEIYLQLSDIINKSFLLIGSYAIDFTDDLIKKELQNANEISNKYLIKLIEKILEEKKCICGTEVTSDIKSVLLVEKAKLSKEKQENPVEEILTTLATIIPNLREKKEKILLSLTNLYLEKEKLKKELDNLRKKLDEIEQILGNHPVEDIRKLQNNLFTYSQDYGSIKERINTLETQLKIIKTEIEFLKREIHLEEKKEKEIVGIKKKKDLAEEILKQLEIVYEKLSKNLKVEIEKEATKIFESLIRKKGFFKGIELSEDYILKLIDTYGDREAKTEISAGERQVLSLSFILALAKVSNKEAPFVMDTPFGRLDPEHRRNILQNLPYLTRQLVLLVTPSEMTPELRNLIDSKVDKEYELEFDEIDQFTKIKPIGVSV